MFVNIVLFNLHCLISNEIKYLITGDKQNNSYMTILNYAFSDGKSKGGKTSLLVT